MRAKAKAKQVAGGKDKLPQKSAKPIETREEIAKSAGVSHDTIHKTKTILAKATPIVKERARSGEISVNRAYIETIAPEQGTAVLHQCRVQ